MSTPNHVKTSVDAFELIMNGAIESLRRDIAGAVWNLTMPTSKTDTMEQFRCTLQSKLDGHKSQAERNKLGQFATPTKLARDVLAYGLDLLPNGEAVRFLDPAIGSGSFYSALLSTCRRRPVASAQGFEIDPHYGKPALARWLLLIGSTSGKATESTYTFCRDVVGYDLAAFFERNSGRIKAELEAILQKLLEASP